MYAVIFKTKRKQPIPDEYLMFSNKLKDLLEDQEGFIKVDSIADEHGNGVSISYWSSLESITQWKKQSLHSEAQKKGKEEWYDDYSVEVCEVIRSYGKNKKL